MTDALRRYLASLDEKLLADFLIDKWVAGTQSTQWALDIFTAVGFSIDGVRASNEHLPEILTLYRGCADNQILRPSWTESVETAEAFREERAASSYRAHAVYVCQVRRDAVLARFNLEGYREVVIDPDRAMNVERLRCVVSACEEPAEQARVCHHHYRHHSTVKDRAVVAVRALQAAQGIGCVRCRSSSMPKYIAINTSAVSGSRKPQAVCHACVREGDDLYSFFGARIDF